MAVSGELKEILVCPRCKGPLEYPETRPEIDCLSCKLAYPVEDDAVPVMIPEEARPLVEAPGQG